MKLPTLFGESVKIHFLAKLKKDEKARFKDDLMRLANSYEFNDSYVFSASKAIFSLGVELRNNTVNYTYHFPALSDKKA